ncbi:sulfatase [Haloarcula sp. K1]|uniref:sulfatase n=2 Tax=Haloarcula TaxID=2237 RepID=UPI0007BB2EB2|nr:sulfatase [Haloarcula sp. K1]KZX49225.1 sulfatase [Haloarcula sp. K1]
MNNVVLIVMDTARMNASQHLDCLLEDATRFDQAFSASPWTLPSHASIFTGLYPSKHGAHAGHKQLEPDVPVLAEVFRDAGYETVGVSNNTWISNEFGFGRGFERFHKTWQYVQSDTDLGRIARTTEGLNQFRTLAKAVFDGNPVANIANAAYGKFFRKQTDSGAERTNEWIDHWLTERDRSRPFFLFINYLEPHLEYRPPKEFAEQFLPSNTTYEDAMEVPQDAWGYISGTVDMTERDFEILQGLYMAEISYLNHRIGQLRETLQAAGEWQDTVFVVTGDHGENIGDHGLMDHQYCLYDTLLRVPLLIHGDMFSGRNVVSDIVQLPDLGPTLLDAVDIAAPDFREQTQGQSFHPESDNDTREYAIAEYMAPQPSMEALKKRIGHLPDHVIKYDRSLRAVRGTKWKLIRGSDESIELYDIDDDPGEINELSESHPDIVQNLESELDGWLASFEQTDQDGNVDMRTETRDRLEDLGYLQ